jgi:hypothetical protein
MNKGVHISYLKNEKISFCTTIGNENSQMFIR